jgi:hypothetical protein
MHVHCIKKTNLVKKNHENQIHKPHDVFQRFQHLKMVSLPFDEYSDGDSITIINFLFHLYEQLNKEI